jgi:hypothetical protein
MVAFFAGLNLAQAQPAEKFPAVIKKELTDMANACLDLKGKPAKSPGILHVIDLNGDGLPDYIIDTHAFNCEGAPNPYLVRPEQSPTSCWG